MSEAEIHWRSFLTTLQKRITVAADIRNVLDSLDRPSADRRLKELVQRYATTTPKLANWLEENLPQGLTV